MLVVESLRVAFQIVVAGRQATEKLGPPLHRLTYLQWLALVASFVELSLLQRRQVVV